MKLITRTLSFDHNNPTGIWFMDDYSEDTVIYFSELRRSMIDHSVSYHVSDVGSVMHIIELVPDDEVDEMKGYWQELIWANEQYWLNNNITVTENIQDVVDQGKPSLNV